MSTFKVPPVYGEVLFRLLDAARREGPMTTYNVLKSCDWTFKGGTFGVREDPVPKGAVEVNDTCGLELPKGRTRDMAKAMEKDATRRGLDILDPEENFRGPKQLADIITTRAEARTPTVNEVRSWTTMFAYASDDERTVVTGMPAVFWAADQILDGAHWKRGVKTSRWKHKKLSGLVEELTVAGALGAELSTTHTQANASTALEMMKTYRVPELSGAEAQSKSILGRMTGMRGGTAFKDFGEEIMDLDDLDEIDLEDHVDLDDLPRESRSVCGMKVEIFPRCVVIRKSKKSYVFGLSDWRKVIIMVTGFRNYLVGCCADACVGSIAQIAAASRTVSAVYVTHREAVKAGVKVPFGQHLEFAKLYKGLLSVVKARSAGERAAQHAKDLLGDVQASVLYPVCKTEIRSALARITCLTAKGSLAAAKIFRLFPPPDVWMVDALRSRWEKASLEFNVDEELLDEFDNALVEVILTSRCYDKSVKLELRDENNRPSWWSHYLTGEYDKVPKSELATYVKIDNTITCASRSRYDPAVWKDSALGLDTFVLAMMTEVDRDLKNMLTRMLYDPECPMPDVVNTVFEEISAVMLKPESHKERIAYMNNLSSRFRQSITEATVSGAMKAHPSFAPVKSGNERDLIFEALSSPPPTVMEAPMRPEFKADYWVTLFYSFDITGWSERMCANLQRRSHCVWDRFCGGRRFAETEKNHNRAIVYMNNGGVKAWYRNGGANFEGYNGKEMTALHVAIMTVAVKELRKRCKHVPDNMLRIVLQAYIDDGVCRMTLPSSICEMVFELWQDVVAETWLKFGFTIEPKKSYPSYFYFEFLGEEFFAGRQLAAGSKAAMRITAEPFEYWESLPERVGKISAACRGASVSGTPSFGAVLMQSYFVAMEVSRWVDISDATATAFWCLAPRAVGGMGVPSLVAQSTNATAASIEEGYAALHSWARSTDNAAVSRGYIALTRRGLAPRTAAEVLASPLGGQPTEGRVTVNPLGRTVARGLKNKAARGELSPLANVVVDMMDKNSNDSFAAAVIPMVPGEVKQEALLRDLRDGTLDPIASAFVGRFEKESSFLRLSTRGKLFREARLGRAQTKTSYEVMRRLVIPHSLN